MSDGWWKMPERPGTTENIGVAWMTSAAQPTCCTGDTSTSGEQATGTLGIISVARAVEKQM